MKKLNLNTMYDWPLGAKGAVLAVVFLVALYMGYYFSISSLMTRYDDLTLQEVDLKQQFEMVVIKKELLQAEMVEYPSLQNSLAAWRRQLPLDVELPELLNEILKMGASHHIFFSLFDPGEEIKVDPYWHVPIKIIMVGSYDKIAIFLSQLANMPWILQIENFIFSDENKNDVLGAQLAKVANEQNLLTAEVNINIYFVPGKSTEVKPAEAKPGDATSPIDGKPADGK